MTNTDIQIKHHCRRLTEEETQRLVEDVADLIVCFLKKRPAAGQLQAKTAGDHPHFSQETKGPADEDRS